MVPNFNILPFPGNASFRYIYGFNLHTGCIVLRITYISVNLQFMLLSLLDCHIERSSVPRRKAFISVLRAIEQTSTRIRAREQLENICEQEHASTHLNFASKSSKGQILWALENFKGAFNTPLFPFLKLLYLGASSQAFVVHEGWIDTV